MNTVNLPTVALATNSRHRPPPPLDSILIGADIIKASKSAKNIDVRLDSAVSMDVQINNICKTNFFNLRNIAKIRKFLTHRQCEIFIHAFISLSWIIVTSFYLAYNSHKLIDYNMYKI